MVKPIWVVLALLALGCSSGQENVATSDSNSNWLTACSEDADCDPEDSCVNDRCHAPCDDERGCSGTASECRALSAADGCVEPAGGEGYCFVPCSDDADCAPLGGDFHCARGVCSSEPQTCGGAAEPEPAAPEPEPSGVEPSPGVEPEPTAPDAGPEPVDCPVVASECPPECHAIDSSPLFEEGLCFLPREILGCVAPNQDATDDDNCLRRADGTLFPGISGTYAAGFVASGEFTPCTREEEDRLSQAIGTCDGLQGPACGAAICDVGERCCDSCTGSCAGANDDILCIEDTEPDRTCEEPECPILDDECSADGGAPPLDGGAPPDDSGMPLADVLYSADRTIPMDCCDNYSVLRADALLDLCLIVDIRHQLGGEPVLTGSRALSGSEDCWERAFQGVLPTEEGVAASAFSGEVSVAYEVLAGQLTLDVVAEFADPPTWLPATLSASFTDLPIDGEWYPGE